MLRRKETDEGHRQGRDELVRARGSRGDRNGGCREARGAPSSRSEDGRERTRRGVRCGVRRLRRGRRRGRRAGGPAERGRPAAALRDRGFRGLGRGSSLRRRDRRVRRGVPRLSAQAEFARIAAEDGRAALVTALGGPQPAKLLVRADGTSEGTLGDEALDRAARKEAEELMWAERSELRELEGASLFIDVTAPAPRLVIFGAVDYAAALCRLARAAGWRPFVCDPRSQFATRERFPEAEEVVAAWPDDALARLGGIDRATYIAVLTHDPKLDDATLTVALRSEAAYVGAMGSRRAQAQRRERLLSAGIEEELLERIAAPIGLDLGAVTPEETALSIMAEVVAVRNGRDGGRLSQIAGRIHEVGA